NPAVATVSADGTVAPRGAGQTTLKVTAPGGASRDVPVTVTGAARRPVSFANDVMPVLARAGCNSGACHGSASGKKGFRVSLRASRPGARLRALDARPPGPPPHPPRAGPQPSGAQADRPGPARGRQALRPPQPLRRPAEPLDRRGGRVRPEDRPEAGRVGRRP